MITDILTKSTLRRLSECILLLILVGPKVVCRAQYTWCRDYHASFDLNPYYYNKNCAWVASYPKYRCSIDSVKERCPKTCNNCECMNSRINFLVANTVTGESFHATCDWVKQDVRARCGSEYSGPLENCPLDCGLCRHDTMAPTPSGSTSGIGKGKGRRSPMPSTIPTLIPTKIPTKRPSSTPSKIPSSFPSSTPSYEPSLFPSGAPSVLPSVTPSLDPSVNPSMTPTVEWCPAQGFLGQTIFVKDISTGLCIKIELFENGILGIEPKNLNCTSAASDPLKVKRESFFQNMTSAITYYFEGHFEPVGWSGQLRFKEDENTSSMIIQKGDLILDTSKRYFSADISVPICMTQSPSVQPSALPSALPSMIPSKHPSFMPSEVLSMNPSHAPSVGCDLTNLMGQTIFSEWTSITSKKCLKIEVFQGGVLEVGPSSEDCLAGNSTSLQTVSYFKNIKNDTLIFDKETLGSSGWSGHFYIVEDPTVMGSETMLLSASVISGTKMFEAELRIPTCHVPSTTPSLIPSVSPTPECNVEFPQFVGDGICDDDIPGYYTEACDWDGGDCDERNATYPLCPGPLAWLSDCECDSTLNTTECGFDGGDCIGQSDCTLKRL